MIDILLALLLFYYIIGLSVMFFEGAMILINNHKRMNFKSIVLSLIYDVIVLPLLAIIWLPRYIYAIAKR
jgi:hypothetical protein